jgi:NADH:ubiquinone oxidoreductase subunit H
LMHMGWRILIPLALLNILGTAFWVLYQNGQLF